MDNEIVLTLSGARARDYFPIGGLRDWGTMLGWLCERRCPVCGVKVKLKTDGQGRFWCMTCKFSDVQDVSKWEVLRGPWVSKNFSRVMYKRLHLNRMVYI